MSASSSIPPKIPPMIALVLLPPLVVDVEVFVCSMVQLTN